LFIFCNVYLRFVYFLQCLFKICLLFTMFILDLFIFYHVYFLQCLFKICLLFTMFILDLYSIKEETDTDLYSNRR
jgi:hypothetical protein